MSAEPYIKLIFTLNLIFGRVEVIKMSIVPPLQPEQIVNFLYVIYYFFRDLIVFILQNTIFKDYPEYAATYGDAITFLVSITAIYLILELVVSAKKIVRILLVIGWALLFITIAISIIR